MKFRSHRRNFSNASINNSARFYGVQANGRDTCDGGLSLTGGLCLYVCLRRALRRDVRLEVLYQYTAVGSFSFKSTKTYTGYKTVRHQVKTSMPHPVHYQ